MEKFFKYALTILISSVAIIEFYQVLMRYIFEIPVMGIDEILVYPTLWLYFMGSVNASREDTQIKANVLEVFLHSEKAKLVVRIFADVFSLIISCWLTTWAWDYFQYAWKIWKESPTLYIPTFYAEMAFFIGMALMTVFICWYFFKHIQAFVLMTRENRS